MGATGFPSLGLNRRSVFSPFVSEGKEKSPSEEMRSEKIKRSFIGEQKPVLSGTMETDSFFWQLFKHLPETIFELIDQPVDQVKNYRFDSVEVKKSYRIDGMLVPRRTRSLVYFIEVSFFRRATFYVNLFAKVFGYLEENIPGQDWHAVAIFANKKCEPKMLKPYRNLLEPDRVRRIYVDELLPQESPSPGLGMMQLLTTPKVNAPQLVNYLVHDAAASIADSDKRVKVVQLVEELLLRRFTGMNREEIRTMFKLHDIRKSRVWQEAKEEGREEGETKKMVTLARKWIADGATLQEIAKRLYVTVEEAQELVKKPVSDPGK